MHTGIFLDIKNVWEDGSDEKKRYYQCTACRADRGTWTQGYFYGSGTEECPNDQRAWRFVDLALCGGVPTFRQVMDAVLDEAEIESYTIAKEIVEKNPELLSYIREKLPEAEGGNDPAYRAEGRSAG